MYVPSIRVPGHVPVFKGRRVVVLLCLFCVWWYDGGGVVWDGPTASFVNF